MKHLLKCVPCNSYTLKEACAVCSATTVPAIPPRYSPDDKYGDYRRKAKEVNLRMDGLL
ncbi:nucleolar RNA-binding Nop10p family protein [Candidatus Woesearchaeota archaeon]|nr:nucleolar RNA-binding Nop10p family protein [Candidatus Woesearchaeota archaeon]